jgi:hypothetical protein
MSHRLRLASCCFILLAATSAHADEAPLVPLCPGTYCLPCDQCHCYDRCYSNFRIYWLEYEASRTNLILREVKCDTSEIEFEFDHCDEEHIQTEMVLKPREIIREITCCTSEPVKQVDPCTGCTTYCFVPKTEVKQIKEIVFDLCPEQKVYKVRKLLLKPVEKNYTVRKFWLDMEEEKLKELRGTLVPCENHEHVISCPPPCSGRSPESAAAPIEQPTPLPEGPGELIAPPKGTPVEGK